MSLPMLTAGVRCMHAVRHLRAMLTRHWITPPCCLGRRAERAAAAASLLSAARLPCLPSCLPACLPACLQAIARTAPLPPSLAST